MAYIALTAAVSCAAWGVLKAAPPVVDDVVQPVDAIARPRAGKRVAAATPTREDRMRAGVAANPFALLLPNAPAKPASTPQVAKAHPQPSLARLAASSTPPAPPTAPPLPFAAAGSVVGAEVTGGQRIVFLTQQDKLFVVRAGDVIGGTYRVATVDASRIEFIYLPLQQHQFLNLAP